MAKPLETCPLGVFRYKEISALGSKEARKRSWATFNLSSSMMEGGVKYASTVDSYRLKVVELMPWCIRANLLNSLLFMALFYNLSNHREKKTLYTQ